MLLDPLALTIGASGAVFGLMGSTVTFQIRRGVNPWSSGIGSLLALNLVFTFIRPNISIGGHIGGLIGGLILGWMYDEIDLRRLPRFIGALISWVYVTVCVVVTIWAAGRWWDPVLG